MASKTSKAGRKTSNLGAKRKLDAFPDRMDAGDWAYQPSLLPLPDTIANCGTVPVILDQGSEGACTGFALSAVVNYLLAQRNAPSRCRDLATKIGHPISPQFRKLT